MTSAHKPVFLVVSQNQDIAELVQQYLSSEATQVEISSPQNLDKLELTKLHYIIFVIQRSQNSQSNTQAVIELYDLAKAHQSKVAIIDIHNSQIQTTSQDTTFQLLNKISDNQPLFRYLITKDIYQDKDSRNIFALEQKIKQATLDKKIEVSSRGDTLLHPLNLEDLVAATLKSLFLERLAGKKLVIIGDSLKDLDLAYTIKDELGKKDKQFIIDTITNNIVLDNSTINLSSESRALLKWLPDDSNEDKLRRKISSLITSPPDNQFQHKDYKQPATNEKKTSPLKVEKVSPSRKDSLHRIEKKFIASTVAILLTISLVSFGLISSIYIFLLSSSLSKTKVSLDYLSKGDTDKVSIEINTASNRLQTGEDISQYILPIYSVIFKDLSANTNNFTSLLKHSQSTIQSINESYQLSGNLYHDLFTPSGKSEGVTLSLALQSRLRTLHQELSQIKIISENYTFPAYFNEKLKEIGFADKIDTLVNQTTQSLKLLESFSSLISSSKTEYLALILQDTNELKSSGGTIRSLVLANLENQKITNIRVLSSGQIDQQMVGQIPSTSIIQSLTGQENLSFINSNVSPNFIETSQMIDKFLKNSVNFSADLIVGITTQTFADIVTELGSLKTPSNTFTANTFNQQMAESSLNHTASQTTVSLLEKVVQDLQTQNIPLIRLARPIINTLNQDSLRLWYRDPVKENSIIDYSFAGNIFPSECHPLISTNNCFADTAYLAENNFSIAPLNFFSTRQLQHQVTLQDREVLHTFAINYQYSSPPQDLNRDYQALYQIYLHPSAQFVNLEKNNQEVDVSINKEIVNGLSLFQVPLLHSPQGDVSVKINFKLENVLSTDSSTPLSYSIKTYHQPGTELKNNQLIINHPLNLSIAGVTSSASIGSGQIIYQPSNISNLNSVFGVQFASQP
jgi:hypothetical protein